MSGLCIGMVDDWVHGTLYSDWGAVSIIGLGLTVSDSTRVLVIPTVLVGFPTTDVCSNPKQMCIRGSFLISWPDDGQID